MEVVKKSQQRLSAKRHVSCTLCAKQRLQGGPQMLNNVLYTGLASNGQHTCKSLKFRVGFNLRISRMNCFHEIKYHANILAVHCNNVTTQNPRN